MTEPEQWAVELWHLAHRAYVLKARDSHREGAVDAALTIQRAFEERERELREAAERCIQIVERYNNRQNEKVEDVKLILRHALATRQDAPKACEDTSHDQ